MQWIASRYSAKLEQAGCWLAGNLLGISSGTNLAKLLCMDPYPVANQITAVILAGGRSSRFGGKDKGLIKYRQRPIIEHIINAIQDQVAGLIINANRNLQAYAAFDHLVVSDELSDYQGPLAGFSIGMKQAKTAYILTLPCDGPMIPPNYVKRMAAIMTNDKVELVVAHDGERLQPVHTLLAVSLLANLNEFLASGERKIDRWFAQHQYALADFSNTPEIFSNINTQEDLERLQNNDE